jgi:Asp-tRNA(Asn)/Glu-tRNA(Gln) amidotransferase A subunit family amidase
MSQKYAAAIFDFEGTLVDFQWQLKPASAPVGLMIAGPALSDQRILSVGLAIETPL